MLKKNKKNYKEVTYSDEWEMFERGINYYNANNFSHAIKTWEIFSECCENFDKNFVKILIETAKLGEQNPEVVKIRNIGNLIKKLKPYSPEHFGINVDQLLAYLSEYKKGIEDDGGFSDDLKRLKLDYSPPSNPDIDMEVAEICQMPGFLDGIELFNNGYYWEAHENWQELWRDQTGRGKLFIETFVQLAEAYSFMQRGKLEHAVYLLGKVLKRFQEFKKVQCKIEIKELIKNTEQILEDIECSRRNGNSVLKITPKPIKI